MQSLHCRVLFRLCQLPESGSCGYHVRKQYTEAPFFTDQWNRTRLIYSLFSLRLDGPFEVIHNSVLTGPQEFYHSPLWILSSSSWLSSNLRRRFRIDPSYHSTYTYSVLRLVSPFINTIIRHSLCRQNGKSLLYFGSRRSKVLWRTFGTYRFRLKNYVTIAFPSSIAERQSTFRAISRFHVTINDRKFSLRQAASERKIEWTQVWCTFASPRIDIHSIPVWYSQ